MVAVLIQANPFVSSTFTFWGMAVIVAAAGVSAVINAWLQHRPKLAVVMAVCGLLWLAAWQVARVRQQTAYPVTRSVFIECNWFCWPFY